MKTKPTASIKIEDLLSGPYLEEWKGKRRSLDSMKIRRIIKEIKIKIFNLMGQKIDELRSTFPGHLIKIYKKTDYTFSEADAIRAAARSRPKVSKEKIEWEDEDDGPNMVFQVNFASEHYGGATFGQGFVQEEIKNVLSTTSSILTANNTKLGLAPRTTKEEPTPVVIVGQIKDFDNIDLPYGSSDQKWNTATMASMIRKSTKRNIFNELAIAADDLGKEGRAFGKDTSKSIKALFNNAFAGFSLAKQVADGERKNCKIKTGLFGAGAFCNSPEFSIAMQYLASRIANVDIEFCGIDIERNDRVEDIFVRVDEMIISKMSLDQIAKELQSRWMEGGLDRLDKRGWRTRSILKLLEKTNPSLNGHAAPTKTFITPVVISRSSAPSAPAAAPSAPTSITAQSLTAPSQLRTHDASLVALPSSSITIPTSTASIASSAAPAPSAPITPASLLSISSIAASVAAPSPSRSSTILPSTPVAAPSLNISTAPSIIAPSVNLVISSAAPPISIHISTLFLPSKPAITPGTRCIVPQSSLQHYHT